MAVGTNPSAARTAGIEGKQAAGETPEGEKVVAMPTDMAKPKFVVNYEVGEAVTILEGPLALVS